ncbi:D-2-hydroxyacid dehydrogenase [Bacillaceae bacterium SIJ1]|uniref:D-2-hydroxyacid dehydrogenase n=1 Tax=Litoribacterium kuwaitense TaxID=1398745 RepID=UPI0013ED9E34|nr:D-2-hydroxyacid dehydrogenase [Litoribacterium kuwaitense]NGP45302.1 D-2-hydroxyacid dehydrogenase [Litoribacterium kuwaitense]
MHLFIDKKLTQELVQLLKTTHPSWTITTRADLPEPDYTEIINQATAVAAPTKELLDMLAVSEMTSINWLQMWSAGVDNLPIQTFASKGIKMTTASGVHALPIAETILAMMLSWTRKIPQYVRQQAEGIWHHAGLRDEMHHRTVVIFGTGAIGQRTAELCKAFQMKTVGVSRSGKSVSGFDTIFTVDQAEKALHEGDYIVNTLPLTEATAGFFNKAHFQQMKAGAFFVNIGRGQTVDQAALLDALKNEEIAGAGLDVFDPEPLPEDHPFWTMDNVIMTPHTAGSTRYYDERVCKILHENMSSFTSNGTLDKNLVNVELGY